MFTSINKEKTLVRRLKVRMNDFCNSASNNTSTTNQTIDEKTASITINMHEYFTFGNTDTIYLKLTDVTYGYSSLFAYAGFEGLLLTTTANVIDSYDIIDPYTLDPSGKDYGKRIDPDEKYDDELITLPVEGMISSPSPNYNLHYLKHMEIINPKIFTLTQHDITFKVYISDKYSKLPNNYPNLPGLPYYFLLYDMIEMKFDILK